MKKTNRLILLAAILGVICIATLLLTRYEERQEKIQASEEVILQIPADSVQALSWEYAEGGLSFHSQDGTWFYDEDEAFPVSTQKVETILSHFEAFGITFRIEDVEDYSQYGLDDPECTISLHTAEETHTIRLGDFSKMDEQRYVDIGDGCVYLVAEDPMDYIDDDLSSMILHDDTPGFESVTDIRFSGDEEYTILRQEDSTASYSSEDVYFLEKDGALLPLDTSSVTQYLNTITALDLLDYVTYNATEQELEDWGLAAPELSVTVGYTHTDENENTVDASCTVHISRNPEELKAAQEAEKNGESVTVTKYVRVGDSPIVYILDDADHAILAAASYDDLRHKEVFWGDTQQLTQLDISLEGKTHTLTASVNEEEETVWLYGEEEISLSGITTALEALSANSFTQDAPVGEEEIRLTLHLDNENISQVEICLYRQDGTACLAQVDGQSVSLVSRSAVIDLVEAVQSIVLN